MRKYNMATLTIKAFPKGETLASLRDAVATVSDLFTAYRRARRERAQLLSLDERELHDIGLSRLDAVSAARRPLWRGLTIDPWWRGGRP
jgi:uncharacterized protein YjiS (DUF1127 family)